MKTNNYNADLLNGASNHTQVVIKIEDHNDNSPQFSLDTVEITVREDQPMHEPFYIVHATDKDKKMVGISFQQKK
uniref:Cadherin domain-containing protein n=1 Tax=Heterorhabditis bacteriophora TaxID=37862 RepID=A0A1I7WFA2_HETBA